MAHIAVTYSLIGLHDFLDRANPIRCLAFLPDGSDPMEELKDSPWELRVHETVAATDPAFADRFWYVQYVEDPPAPVRPVGPLITRVTPAILSTEQILTLLERGRTVRVISGPFATEGDAQYDMDVRWESHE